MSILFNRWFTLVLRIIIGAVFLYAGILKVGDPLAFSDSIATFRVLPDTLINLLAIGLPPLEILVGLLLIAGWQHRCASFTAVVLSAIFAIALMQGIARGLEIDCGCFGNSKPSPFKVWLSLGRDLLLLIASLYVYRVNIGVLRVDVGGNESSGDVLNRSFDP